MFYQLLFYVAAVEAFAFPQLKWPKKQDVAPTCALPIVYTVVEYPYVVQTWAPPKTVTVTDVNNVVATVTETATQFLTTLTSSSTVSHNRTTRTRTVQRTVSTTVTMPGALPPTSQVSPVVMPSSMPAPLIPPSSAGMVLPPSTMAAPIPSSTASSMPTQNCLPSTSDYPGVNNVPANTTYLIQLYYLSGGNPITTGAYLTNTSGYTYNSFDAVKVFLADGVLFASDPTYGIGWYATTSPAVDAPFALSEYLPNSGMTAKTFSFGNAFPYALTWDNCGFVQSPATFVWNEDSGQIVVVFDGNTNQGTNHQPMILGVVPPPV